MEYYKITEALTTDGVRPRLTQGPDDPSPVWHNPPTGIITPVTDADWKLLEDGLPDGWDAKLVIPTGEFIALFPRDTWVQLKVFLSEITLPINAGTASTIQKFDTVMSYDTVDLASAELLTILTGVVGVTDMTQTEGLRILAGLYPL